MNSSIATGLLLDLTLILFTAALAGSRPQRPSLTKKLRASYTIDPRAYPQFTKCTFSGEPTPSISWMLNSKLLPSKEQENGPFFSGTEGILNLSKARMSDSGNYSCIGTNTFGSTSESTTIIIIQGKEASLWLRWWMLYLYAIAAWLLSSLFLLLYYVYRRCTTKKRPRSRSRPRPQATDAVNTDDYICYETEQDLSPRYTFANPSAEMELSDPTTFTGASASAPSFRDERTLEGTGYINAHFVS